MWELRGWSGWKLAVFPRLEILLFLSFPFLWVHPLWVYPPGRVCSLSLFLFHSCVCPLFPRVSASSFPLFPPAPGWGCVGTGFPELRLLNGNSINLGIRVGGRHLRALQQGGADKPQELPKIMRDQN